MTLVLHQGSTLSSYLFALVLDELTRLIQEEVPCCMLVVDDIVLIDETKDGVNAQLELWRDDLESKRFKISQIKKICMDCNFRQKNEWK